MADDIKKLAAEALKSFEESQKKLDPIKNELAATKLDRNLGQVNKMIERETESFRPVNEQLNKMAAQFDTPAQQAFNEQMKRVGSEFENGPAAKALKKLNEQTASFAASIEAIVPRSAVTNYRPPPVEGIHIGPSIEERARDHSAKEAQIQMVPLLQGTNDVLTALLDQQNLIAVEQAKLTSRLAAISNLIVAGFGILGMMVTIALAIGMSHK